jgi:hypothetical protein
MRAKLGTSLVSLTFALTSRSTCALAVYGRPSGSVASERAHTSRPVCQHGSPFLFRRVQQLRVRRSSSYERVRRSEGAGRSGVACAWRALTSSVDRRGGSRRGVVRLHASERPTDGPDSAHSAHRHRDGRAPLLCCMGWSEFLRPDQRCRTAAVCRRRWIGAGQSAPRYSQTGALHVGWRSTARSTRGSARQGPATADAETRPATTVCVGRVRTVSTMAHRVEGYGRACQSACGGLEPTTNPTA